MSDTIILAVIIAVPPTLTAIASLIVAIRTKESVEQVRIQTDGINDKLMIAEKGKSFLEGKQDTSIK